MHQNIADQMKTQSCTFVISRVDLAHHSCVPRRYIADGIPLSPRLRSWYGGAEAMLLMGGAVPQEQTIS